MMKKTQRIVIIGYGAVAQAVLRHLAAHPAGSGGQSAAIEVAAVLLRPGWRDKERKPAPMPVDFIDSIDQALGLAPDLVIECANQGAVREYAMPVLAAGIDFMAISMGVFADDPYFAGVKKTAAESGARIYIPGGAVGGLDLLAAVRHDGIDRVLLRATKPPKAWAGTPAEKAIDLANVQAATCFFEGSAREAALAYPQNANIAAAVALAGLGFDGTRVELCADPAAPGNRNEIIAEGPFGRFAIDMVGKTRPDAPRTSISAPLSIVRAILGRTPGIVV